MNQKRIKEIRRKAFNLWNTSKTPLNKRISFKKFYKLLKKGYKSDQRGLK